MDRALNDAQARIRFPDSLRVQYLDLIKKDAEQAALRRITRAKAGEC